MVLVYYMISIFRIETGQKIQTQDFLGPPRLPFLSTVSEEQEHLAGRRTLGLNCWFYKTQPHPHHVGSKTAWGQPNTSYIMRLSLGSREINCYYYG